ncbi:MAG: hypothetical protein HN726_02335 [Candidatus Magasanikbacteria bacterium]|jgi:hypothetical protein|nr:hypothetical protein [Candidatus Magasanikbacteria bacterium]MBT4221408.1 hypothetical protein [Candidatus Magasanikbacteria bacterium]MBT4350744.1 hypothetical protein [Candidatus Magasanikbacteria bacterium]MBT4541580.1 hypothetical protein [Candidatus Magasanikbacteria bacterium]MBT6253532.1 hypothetical protein [Candidatus Magasanikbacteria bacterium]
MITHLSDSLKENVVVLLGTKGALKAEDIYQIFKQNNTPTTIQGIYRLLRQLQQSGVVIKEQHRYSLRISWVTNMRLLVEKMENTYSDTSYLETFIPTHREEKRIWYFNDPIRMIDFWHQILIVIAQFTYPSTTLHYYPHTWPELLTPKRTQQFYKTYHQLVNHVCTVIGGRTTLDKFTPREISKIYRKNHYYSPPEDYPEESRSMYISVLDEYIVTMRINKRTTEMIDTLYQSTESPDKSPLLIKAIATQKTKNNITLKRDPQKARIYQKKFTNLFGPLYTSRKKSQEDIPA